MLRDILTVGLMTLWVGSTPCWCQDLNVKAEVTDEPMTSGYALVYRLKAGEMIRWRTRHQATTMTRINKVENFDRAVTETTKVWRVKEVREDGSMVLEQSIDQLELSQSVGGGEEIRYDSQADEQPPIRFESIAGSVGVPLALVTISPSGKVLEKEAIYKQSQMGLDDVAVPLPQGRVEIGHTWYSPSEFAASVEDGRQVIIKLRKSYTLDAVKQDIATIHVETEILTPGDSPRVKSQLIQEMTSGTIKFDLQAGRVVSKKMEWDEEVVGFSTAQSYMDFHARFTEDLLSQSEALEAEVTAKPEEVLIRGREEGPILRK